MAAKKDIAITGKENLLDLFGCREKIKAFRTNSDFEPSLIEYIHKLEGPYPDNILTYKDMDKSQDLQSVSECCKTKKCNLMNSLENIK